jgi:RNA polymerase sigma-70 factor, ECF subfamily
VTDDLLALIDLALSGRAEPTRLLLKRITPIVQARAARALWRRGKTKGRDPRQELEDMVQNVFVALFDNDGRVLRAWDPARGLSLENFVGLVAERETACILRSGKRSPWTEDPWDQQQFEPIESPAPDPQEQAYTRQMLGALVDQLRIRLSPLGMAMFRALFVNDVPIPEVCAQFAMTPDAVYAWKSRLTKLVHKVAQELKTEPEMSDPGPAASYTLSEEPP